MQEPEEYDVSDTILDQLKMWKRKAKPHRRNIIIVCSILLTLLVVFLGFAWSEVEKCNRVGGILDAKMVCHPGYYDKLEDCQSKGGKLDDKMVCNYPTDYLDFNFQNE